MIYGPLAAQLRPVALAQIQDDAAPVCVSHELANFVGKIYKASQALELGIPLATKDSANKPFSSTFKWAGGEFDTRREQVAPRLDVREKYKALTGEMLADVENGSEAASAKINFKAIEILAEVHGFVCNFLERGSSLRNALKSLLRQQDRVHHDLRLVVKRGKSVQDIRQCA